MCIVPDVCIPPPERGKSGRGRLLILCPLALLAVRLQTKGRFRTTLLIDGIESWGQADPCRSSAEGKDGFWPQLLSTKIQFSLIRKLFQVSLYS